MTYIQSVLETERIGMREILLHREGAFYIAYEFSCYAFYTFLKPFKVKVKYVKKVSRDIVSLGFPANSAEKILEGRTVISKDEKLLSVSLFDTEKVEANDYSLWREKLNLQDVRCGGVEDVSQSLQELKSRIISFPLESRTPMECMAFVSDLKKELSNSRIL